MKFGIFMAPQHDAGGHPTLQLERDLELIEHADRLGFDEAWVGEHLSNGFETIPCPEQFLAAASQRTQRIRLGTGVNSLPYHHPFTLANRIALLDHLSRGRAMMGIGPGQSVGDAEMMGLDHHQVRDMMVESAEVIVPLLRGETVTRETSWFTVRDARLQLGLYQDEPDVAVASVFSPSGSKLAGRLGVGLLSLAASDSSGVETLSGTWENLQSHAAESGHVVDRSRWRLNGAMHLAETREQAHSEARTHVLRSALSFRDPNAADAGGDPAAWLTDPDAALEQWTTEGLVTLGGIATVGTPDDAVAAVRRLVEKTDGFGTFLLYIHHAAPWEATKRSLSLFAEYVMPELQGLNAMRQDSLERALANRGRYMNVVQAAIQGAREKHGAAAR